MGTLAEQVERLEATVGALAGSVDDLVSDVPAAELLDVMRSLEVVRRRLDAATVAVVDEVDRSQAHVVDGHLSTRAAVTHLGRLSPAEAGRRVGMARALRRLPELRASFAAGEVPTDHVASVARAVANPRVDAVVEMADAWFAEHARTMSSRRFNTLVKEWERRVDADGAELRDEVSHERRDVTLWQLPDSTWELRGRFGSLQGAVLAEVFARFTEAEALADWTAAREEHGDEVSEADLARSAPQRRADALVALVRQAAAQPLDSVRCEPLVNVVVDQVTFERAMARAAGEEVGPDDPTRDGVRCHTVDGAPLTEADVAESAVVGQVRRVVMGSGGVVVDLGRRRRLFTGAARDAVLLGRRWGESPGCAWLDCGVRSARNQCDHVEPWARGGATSPDNGVGLCGRHNRLKESGFWVTRDADGRLCITRPDGSPVTVAA